MAEIATVEEIEIIIQKLSEGKSIHMEWAEYIKNSPNMDSLPTYESVEDLMGSVDWHNEWASLYDRIIEIMENIQWRQE